MTEPLDDSALALLLIVARFQGWVDRGRIAAAAGPARARSLEVDLAALIRGGAVHTRSSLSPQQLEAEMQQAIAGLRQAQAAGTPFRWQSAQTLLYGLTRSGVDMVRLLNEKTRERGRPT